jgi:endogenous inhibitor of DNA gyrase (YacG/DUF329 family)
MVELPYKRTCKHCNTDFRSKGGNKQFCTQKCKLEFNSKFYTYRPCGNCKTNVRRYKCQEKQENVFCSNKCQGIWRKENLKEENIQLASKMREKWDKNSWKKSIETRIKNGNIIDWSEAGWKQYWRRCNYLTRKIRKQMLENWDGYDYISKEYIKDNLNLHYSHSDYPTLDHIKPRSQCFKEGLSPYEATKPENLAWTTRRNNSKKSQKKLN